MEVLYLTDPSFALHDTGVWHPERPARLEAVEHGIAGSGLTVVELGAPRVDRADLERVHLPEYVDAIERFCRNGGGALDPDTMAVEASWEAAIRAAGAGPHAVELLIDGPSDRTAFLAVRPPGHHALADRAMGFCLFNNIAVTAARLAAENVRVAIIDWDVHHGNGTQAMFESTSEILYVSLHQYPLYPGGGAVGEVGTGAGVGSTVNLAMPPGTAGDVYRSAFQAVVVPVVDRFDPDWILVSSGFDAHRADPLAELALVESDYRSMASSLTTLVDPNRVVTFLEGGYDLAAITGSVTATVQGLFGLPDDFEAPHGQSPDASWAALDDAIEIAGPSWRI